MYAECYWIGLILRLPLLLLWKTNVKWTANVREQRETGGLCKWAVNCSLSLLLRQRCNMIAHLANAIFFSSPKPRQFFFS